MKNKLTAILTGAMLILTTNSLPSFALSSSEYSVNNTATNQTPKNEENLIAQTRRRRRRGRWITRRVVVCNRRRVYNNRQRKWAVVRICRPVSRRIYVRY